MTRYVGAIDQGTTSSRFIIFDRAGAIVPASDLRRRTRAAGGALQPTRLVDAPVRTAGSAPALQLPGRSWTSSKKNSFQLVGFCLM